MASSKWKDFEKDIHAIYAQHTAEGSSVEHDVKILGSDSKVDRQIDVLIRASIRSDIGEHPTLIAIECKNKKRPIDVQGVSEFAVKVRDVQANKGIMLSTSGYTLAALNLARSYFLDLLTYNEVTENQLENLRTLCITAINKDVKWKLMWRPLGMEQENSSFVINHYSDLYREDGAALGTISSQVEQRMDAGFVPGTHGSHFLDFGVVYVLVETGLRPVHLLIEIVIEVRHFVGFFEFLRTCIRDAQKGDTVFNLLRTPHISIRPWEVPQPEWTEVPSFQDMAIQPSFEGRSGPEWAFRK